MVQYGPAICCSKPMTRTPSKGLGTGDERLLRKWRTSWLADACNGLNLDQRILLPERGHAEQRLRRIVLAKVLAVRVPQLLALGHVVVTVAHEVRQLHHVLGPAACARH